jgi:GcrA cell cycle regulator
MGIIHRNGWKDRILGQRHSKAGTRKPRQKDKPRGDRRMKISPPLQPQPIVIHTDNIIPVGQRKTLMELDADSCRWPIGQPGHADFFFCGGLAGEIIGNDGAKKRLSYCAFHCRVAYQPRGPHKEYIPMRKSR